MLDSIEIRNINPKRVAQEVRREFGIDEDDVVDLNQLMKLLNIRYKEAILGYGIWGACKAIGLNRLVVINPKITNYGRKRFTIAHEIGHLLMHQGKHRCDESMLSEFRTKIQIEMEANEFASELLMPGKVVINLMKKYYPSIQWARMLAQAYQVSLTAALIAEIKNTKIEAALVYHDGKRIEWVISSEELSAEIANGTQLSMITRNARYTNSDVEGSIDASIWFYLDDAEEWICTENTAYFSKLEKYATILILERNY